jgi:hypothetical protein
MSNQFTYEWTVTVRHAEKGFGKTFKPVARTYQQAIDGAKNALREQGYDSVDQDAFDFVEIRRGAIVTEGGA